MSDSFAVGIQPCDNYTPQLTEHYTANIHECFRCSGRVSWCMNCHKDHHEHGMQTCPCDNPDCKCKGEK